MRRLFLVPAILFGLLLAPALAEGPGGVVVKKFLTTDVTSAGDPIVLPQGDVELVGSMYDIPAGSALPVHKHPYPRYGYVLQGTLEVTNVDSGKATTFKTGDLILESVDHWHKARTVGDEAVKLLVIDFEKKGASNTVIQK